MSADNKPDTMDAPPSSWDEYAVRAAERLWALPGMPRDRLIAVLHVALIDAMRFAATTSASVATLAVKQPLTDDQLDALRQQDNGALNFVTLRQFRVVARAVEAKHGIGTPAAPGTKGAA